MEAGSGWAVILDKAITWAGVSWAGVDGGNDCYDGNEMDGAGGGWGVLWL